MQILPLIHKAKNILIVCHQRPEGDTLGAGLAFRFLCAALGKCADIVSDSPIPPQYNFMEGIGALNQQTCKRYDLTIVADCADAPRMGKFADYANSTVSINIDHHKTNDRFAKHNIVVPTASSTCEVVYDILKAEGIFAPDSPVAADVLKNMAHSLAVGLSTDTGHFMHSSVNAKVLQTVADLASFGANIHEIANHIYRTKPKERMFLLSRALQTLRFFEHDSICIMTLLLSDFEKYNASPLATEGFIDYPLSIHSTQVAVTITQHEKNIFKVSFRSKGLDVSEVAAVFGGGGHVRASGCQVQGQYEDVVDKIVKAIRDRI